MVLLMKTKFLTVVSAALASLTWVRASEQAVSDAFGFVEFERKFNRKYTPKERKTRQACFEKNMEENKKRNLQSIQADSSATYGVTSLSDLCPEEFEAMYLGSRVPDNRRLKNMKKLYPEAVAKKAAAGEIDWVTKGAVTKVKDQGQCGSCWSFSASGSMEGQWFMETGTLPVLSEQVLVDCSNNDNHGCNGGLQDRAWEWMITENNGTWPNESDYPYLSGGSGQGYACDPQKRHGSSSGPIVVSHQGLPDDEDQIAAWLQEYGPIAIAVDASNGWQQYTGGVVTDGCACTSIDHAVLLVGYGTDSNSGPYWKIKNSWGTGWGESGYIRIQRGNNCFCMKEYCMTALTKSHKTGMCFNTTTSTATSFTPKVDEADDDCCLGAHCGADWKKSQGTCCSGSMDNPLNQTQPCCSADQECCGGCCSPGSCCGGATCCDGVHSTGTVCLEDTACCSEGDTLCGGECCGTKDGSYKCLGDVCCEADAVCGDSCCGAGGVCCGEGDDKHCCTFPNSTCCTDSKGKGYCNSFISTTCCDDGSSCGSSETCCNGSCCFAGGACCDGKCCVGMATCCGGQCCQNTCCSDACCKSPLDTCCGGSCCAFPAKCVNDTCQTEEGVDVNEITFLAEK